MSKRPIPLRNIDIEPIEDGDSEGQAPSAEIPDPVQSRRLRNSLILANVAVWLLVIIAVKWLIF